MCRPINDHINVKFAIRVLCRRAIEICTVDCSIQQATIFVINVEKRKQTLKSNLFFVFVLSENIVQLKGIHLRQRCDITSKMFMKIPAISVIFVQKFSEERKI